MRISELTEKKIIHRPTQRFDEYGNRIYEEYEYDFKYNPISKNINSYRLFAKIIDILPFCLIFHYCFHKIPFYSFLYSIPVIMLLGAISESITGTTIGKKIFRLKVIDDFGNYPKFPKSLARNILCLINFFPSFHDKQDQAGVWYTAMNFNMQLNNQFCKTYIIKESKLLEIKEKLNININS